MGPASACWQVKAFMTTLPTEVTVKGRGFCRTLSRQNYSLDLTDCGGQLICQRDALCAAKGIAIEIAFQKKLGAGLFGGEGFIMQRLVGDGLAFLHAGGTIIKKNFKPERLSNLIQAVLLR